MGKVIHFEIPADNVERASDFYKKIFGWSIKKADNMEYWLTESGTKETPGINGAILKRHENHFNVVNTIHVENIEKTIEDINKSGGKVLTQVTEIPNVGKFAYFKDTEGNTLGILEGKM